MTFFIPRTLHCAKKALVSLALLLTLSSPAMAAEPDVLRFGIYPFANAVTIQKKISPLMAWLSEKLARPVRIVIAPNYITHIRRMGEEKVDLAYAGPSPYVKAHDRFQTIELLAAVHLKSQSNDRMVIITHENSAVRKLEDLHGKIFAFGDHQSYGSHFLPRFVLAEHGITLARLLAYDYVMSHDNVALSVLHRDFDAGGLREDVFRHFSDRPLRVLAGPFPMPPHVIVCKKTLDTALKQKIQSLLLALDKPKIMRPFHPDMEGFVAVRDRDFSQTRRVLAAIEGR